METNEKSIYIPTEPKTIACEYWFNYFGNDTFKGKIITGASVNLAIKAYKNNNEVKFTKYITYKSKDYSDIFSVSFDREKLFTIKRNIYIDNLFRVIFGWDKIEFDIVGYSLDYADEIPKDLLEDEDIPEMLKTMPFSTTQEVSEKDFRDFIGKNIDEFDILDNRKAQVPSFYFI